MNSYESVDASLCLRLAYACAWTCFDSAVEAQARFGTLQQLGDVDMAPAMARMTTEELRHFFATDFPQSEVFIEEIGPRTARVRQRISDRHLRPGDTVSGPVLMSVADAAVYAALLGEIGPVGLAVTTSLNINFFRKPPADRDVIGEARLLKLGKRLAVGEVTIRSEGVDDLVAHATVTYSIPPGADAG